MTPAEELIDVGRGVTLCCQRFGDAADPPLLLVMGLGQQLHAWPDEFVDALAASNLHVVRFDNRDVGRSWHASNRPPRRAQFVSRRFDADQYDLHDMARDTVGLLDALDLKPAHLVGVSMGGMIAQTVAALFPQYVRSLVSMSSSTGARRAGWPAPSTLRLLFAPPATDRDVAAERALVVWRHIGSHGFPIDEPAVRELASGAFDRDPRGAAGMARQLAAILKSGDRTRELRSISAPTLVIHGDRDRMVHPSGGRATAAAIPGARAITIDGLGHDLPRGAWPRFVELITEHVAQAERTRAGAIEVPPAGATAGDHPRATA
jgi:pimeloyl-ACP methyl ester carboxylesterase